MKGLTLAVCLFVVIAAVLCSHGYHGHPHSPYDGYRGVSHGHRHGYGQYYYKRQYCPLKSYSQTVTLKILWGKHWEQCTGTAIRYSCDGYCNHYGSYGDYGGKNFYGGFHRRAGFYKGYYGRKSCCRSATYGKKSQYIKFHCGHYGYKKEHWHSKEPTSCTCSYYCGNGH